VTDPTSVAAVRALARASRLLERASGELNLAHYRVLSAIASGDERASWVAARLALGKPTISAAVDSLSQRGLITRTPTAEDQRVAVLRLTAKGRAALDGVETEMVARLQDLLARTPGGENLLDSLVWLGKAIDDRLAGKRHQFAEKNRSGR
jgi:DNA-binding MarR family transcriptional regulator